MEFKVINEQLPVIAFNFDELKNALAQTLDKYTGIVVTEDTLQGCKSTQKELAGVRIKIDNYRKDKKKELSKPITDFENQCKELIELVEKAEKPIKEGIQVFDDKKRDEKRQTAELIIKHAVVKFELNPKYASQLTVADKYTNLTANAKDVTEDVEIRASLLKEQQNKELEMLEIIKDTIENVNKNINAKMSIQDFQRLITQGVSTKEIMQEINNRADRIKKAEIEAEELRVKKELEAKQAEEERQRVVALPQEPIQVVEPTVEPTQELEKEEPLYFVEIRMVGTKEDTARLGQYLRDNGYNYTVMKKGEVE